MRSNQALPLGKVTILIHTRNRPDFLFRLLTYYEAELGDTGINVIVLDGSDNLNFSKISDYLTHNEYSFTLKVLHHPATTSLTDRLADALSIIASPYILLAADDDIYFFDWIGPAVGVLDADPSFGVVYGHAVGFRLESHKPYGKLVEYRTDHPNPPERWLEADTVLARLQELGKSDWATTGWYALQRSYTLKIIIDKGAQANLDGYHFERFMIFCQAALYKTKKLDCIYLARQIYPALRPPFSYIAEKANITKLMKVSACVLIEYKNIDARAAKELVDAVYQAEIDALRKNDSRRILRAIVNFFPFLRKMRCYTYDLLTGVVRPESKSGVERLLPSPPRLSINHPAIKKIISIVS